MISRNIESIFYLPDDGLIINKPFIEIPPYKHKVPETMHKSPAHEVFPR